MSRSEIGIGLVGCGRIADLQVLGYRDNPDARLVALCDSDEGRLQKRQRQWNVTNGYTDISSLLADPLVDAVEILTPHHVHARTAIEAIRAGKHVSIQKPPARTLGELDEIVKAAEESKAVVSVFENFMHYPPHVKARQIIDNGTIGEPVSVRIKTAVGSQSQGWHVADESQSWRLDPGVSGGGPLTFDHGYHCFNMGRYFIREEIESVHAFITWKQLGPDKWQDGPAMISWRYAGDLASYGSWEVIDCPEMEIRSEYYVSDDRIEIHGTRGIIWINRCTGKLLNEPSVVVYAEGKTEAYHTIPSDWAESFRLGGHAFVDTIKTGRRPDHDLHDARKTLAFSLAAAKSAEQTRVVALSELLGT